MESEIRLVLLVIGALIILAILWDGLRRQRKQKKVAEQRQMLETEETTKQSLFADEYEVGSEQVETEQPEAAMSEATLNEVKDIIFSVEQQAHSEVAREKEVPVLIEPEPEPELEPLEITDEEPVAEPEIAPVVEKTIESTVATDFSIRQEKPDQLIMFTLVAPEDELFGGFSLLQILLSNKFFQGERKIFHCYADENEEGKILFSLAAATKTGEIDITNMARFACKGLVLFMHTKDHIAPVVVFDKMVGRARQLAKSLNGKLKINHDQEWSEEKIIQLRNSLE